MPWDQWLYFPSEGRRAENFFALKISQLWPGANPRTWVPKASMLPLDQRSRCDNMVYTWNKRFDQFCNYVKKKKKYRASLLFHVIWDVYVQVLDMKLIHL
jgi:hypothetical protein